MNCGTGIFFLEVSKDELRSNARSVCGQCEGAQKAVLGWGVVQPEVTQDVVASWVGLLSQQQPYMVMESRFDNSLGGKVPADQQYCSKTNQTLLGVYLQWYLKG